MTRGRAITTSQAGLFLPSLRGRRPFWRGEFLLITAIIMKREGGPFLVRISVRTTQTVLSTVSWNQRR